MSSIASRGLMSQRLWVRVCSSLGLFVSLMGASSGWSQSPLAGQAVYPYYQANQVFGGLYSQHLPQLGEQFEQASWQLVKELEPFCNQGAMATQQPAVNTTFTRALLAWQALATPSLADVVEQRSHRRIDFWPMRLTLLQRTLANPPQGLSDMERVGTPAKGFPTLEYLLNQSLDADSCRYSVWVAMDIAEHATLLKTGLNQHRQDWLDKRVTEDQVGQRYAEWVNQWLGAWERLRWTQMEQPVQRAKSHSSGNAQPEFARLQTERNLLEWRVQFHALLQQGRVAAGAVPPQPGQLIPLEAILRGKGAIDLAQRWHHALSEVEQGFTRLSPGLPSEEVLKVSQTMKRVTVMYQREVSQVLNVPLGFSDADGD